MLRKHFFLVGAFAVMLLMALAGGWRFLAADAGEAEGRPPGAAAGAPGPGGGGGGGGGGGRPATVAVATVAQRPFTDSIEALGVAKARRSVTVTSDTTEMLTRVRFTSGQYVSQGAVLAELKAEEQTADVARAQAGVNQARREYERFRELGRRGFAPQARIDDLRANLEDAQASLSAVQARRQDRVIRAPFSGVIGLTDAAPGMLVSPGTPIATLDDLAVIHVDFDIPERFLAVIREGVAIQATADALPGATLQGRIARLDTRVDPQTRAITARAELPNPGGRIRPGMLLRVLVREGGRTGLAVPEGALQAEGDTTYIFAVADQGGRTVAQRRTVLTGAREGGFVELREGAQAGERVVAEGLNRVRPNQPIRIAGAGGPIGGAARADQRAAR